MENDQIVLSIETAISGGSISLLKAGYEVDFWIGTNKVSKAEDVLVHISSLLARNNVAKSKIDSIVVSLGPGSTTGIRIGVALAKGLKKSLNCHLVNVSVLKAMLLKARLDGLENTIVTAVPINKCIIGWQVFRLNDSKKIFAEMPKSSNPASFITDLKTKNNVILVIHQQLYDKLKGFIINEKHSSLRIEPEVNLARWIGLFGSTKEKI